MNLMKENNVIRKICFILVIIVVIVLAMYSFNKAEVSEDLAKTILMEKFNVCMDLMYPMEPYYTWAEENVMIDDHFCSEIVDYEEVSNIYFTENAKEYYDEYAICVIHHDGKSYITEGGGGFSGYGGIEFENIKISDDTIEADAIQTRLDMDGMTIGYVKSNFKLKNVDGKWKIDEFVDVDDIEKWTEI